MAKLRTPRSTHHALREAPSPGVRRRVVAYVRVSTSIQVEEGCSLAAQQAQIDAYARIYDVDVVAVEIDAGQSAGSLDRPGLARALDCIRQGRADGILVTKLDRLTRSLRDLDTLLSGGLRGRDLVSVHESLDTQTASGRLVLNVLTAVSQWEREVGSERTAAAMEQLRVEGRYRGGVVPYGYSRTPGEEGSTPLLPAPEEQAAVRLARRLSAGGLSLRAIGAHLSGAGLRSRGDGAWRPATVRSLLLGPLGDPEAEVPGAGLPPSPLSG